jgi:hypothetical protein
MIGVLLTCVNSPLHRPDAIAVIELQEREEAPGGGGGEQLIPGVMARLLLPAAKYSDAHLKTWPNNKLRQNKSCEISTVFPKKARGKVPISLKKFVLFSNSSNKLVRFYQQ